MRKETAQQLVARRLKALMAHRQDLDTQGKLAKKSGVGQTTIGRILRSEVDAGIGTLSEIAAAFGVERSYFFSLEEDLSNVSLIETRGLIPLISSVTAGVMCETMDPLEPGDAEEWLPCPVNHSDKTFALRVSGDSMTSQHPGTRSYPEGVVIFVDPEKEATNGARIVAKIASENTSVFKLYVEDMGRKYLKSINTSYPPLDVTDIDFHICGVVIGAFMPE